MKIILLLLLCLLLTFSVQAQTEPKAETEVEISNLSLAKKDAEGNIVEDLEVFGTKDIPIYCYIDLNSEVPTLVKMNFIAVKAKGLRANSRIISVSYKTKKGETGISFDASPKNIWASGDYRVDVFLDEKLSKSKESKIEEPK